jgi:hypothetical protein
VTDQRDQEPSEDYSYDLAHEVRSGAERRPHQAIAARHATLSKTFANSAVAARSLRLHWPTPATHDAQSVDTTRASGPGK